MANITQARELLVSRLLQGDGHSSPGERRAAFNNVGLGPPMSALVDKVVNDAAGVSADDIKAATQSGLTEDQIFELVVCAAVGEADRQYSVVLAILDSGHSFKTKMLFALIRAASRQPTPEPLKLMKYRPDFFGGPMQKLMQEAMRGASTWSVADRELVAAVISEANRCDYCARAHAAVAALAYCDDAKTVAVLANLESAPIEPPLRAILRMLAKLTINHTISADDLRSVLVAGASREQIKDALAVCFALNVIDRLANAFAFVIPGREAFEAGAKFLLARGYS